MDENNKKQVMRDAVTKIVPLCVDYILDFEVAECQQLANLLQLDDKVVRKALNLLVHFGILSKEENVNKDVFWRQYESKLGLKEKPADKEITQYYLNIDIMYVLNARIFDFGKMLKSKTESNTN